MSLKERKAYQQRHCSPAIKSYLEQNSSKHLETIKNNPKVMSAAKKMLSRLRRDLKTCYDFVNRNFKEQSVETCFLAGYDENGKQNFFEFSHNGKKLDKELGFCLNNLKGFWYQKDESFKDFLILDAVIFRI